MMDEQTAQDYDNIHNYLVEGGLRTEEEIEIATGVPITNVRHYLQQMLAIGAISTKRPKSRSDVGFDADLYFVEQGIKTQEVESVLQEI